MLGAPVLVSVLFLLARYVCVLCARDAFCFGVDAVINSEVHHLGYHGTEAYGITYKVSNDTVNTYVHFIRISRQRTGQTTVRV